MNYLIPLDYITEACFISPNINEKKMKANLEEAQSDLRELIGPEFYEQIDTQYVAETLSTANSTLYEDYIKQYLAWQAAFYSLGFSQADSTPTGIREFVDENSTILADVKLFGFEKNVRRRVNRYKYDLLNYLANEQSKDSTAFPMYTAKCMEELSFAITSVSRGTSKDAIISVNRAITNNE
jgi:hypothetical protein